MADKLTPKQEAFAQAYVETGNASEAYRLNYSAENMSDNALWVEAHRTFSNPKVSLRIKELQAEHAKRHAVTIDSLTETLKQAIALANEVEQPSAIVAAVKELGTLHGIRVEKNETRNIHEDRLKAAKERLAEK